jgi:DNA-binding transcriptional MerR regulator
MSTPEKPGHSIRVASRLSSVPIETLRVWERRYGFPRPARSGTGQRRLYSDEDIARLRWIASAIELGYRIGDVVQKPIAELERLVQAERREAAPEARPATNVERLIELLLADDASAIDAELRAAAAVLGPRRFVVELAQPLAAEVGKRWESGELEVHHEHLMSECVETQLRQQLAAFQDVDGSPRVLLATLPDELHALGLAMVALYLAVSAAKPRLLGATTPPDQIAAAARALDTTAVGIAVASSANRAAGRHVAELIELLPRSLPLWIGGAGARSLRVEPSANVRIVESWADLDRALEAAR